MKEKKLFVITLTLGLLTVLSYLFLDLLFNYFWIFYFIPLFSFGITFIVFFILAITRKSKKTIYIGMIIFGILSFITLVNSEILKSKRMLEATLKDDLSSIHLVLRENNTFEVISSTLFTENKRCGKYIIENNKIIFLNKPYDNDFIPDTITILEDKIVLRFDNEGKPNTDFANYFDIKRNKFKNAP